MATISRDARCPHSVSSSSWSPLVEDLVEQHGARGSEIERVDVTDHGDRDDAVADGPLRRRESFSLAAHHEDDGTAIGQGAIVDSRVRRRSDDARARPALPGSQVSVPGAHEALLEDRAHAGAHGAGGIGSVLSPRRIAPSAPVAAAVRSDVPRLPGDRTRSNASQAGRSRRTSGDHRCLTTAAMP